jgi:DNA polymerase III alpha subunit (gram-positive type)
MVDIESTGLNQNNNAILQISAVRFNLAAGTVSHQFFDRCLMIPPNRYWDEDCRNNFWLRTTEMRDVLTGILGRGEDPLTVLTAFADWVGQGARFWSKPTHMDYSFIQHYFEAYGRKMPFKFWEANDMNSWIRARYFPQEVPDLGIEFEGPKHNALYDTLHQVRVLFAHWNDTKNQLLVS